MKKIIIVGLFLIILCIAAFLRLWHLGGVPISPNWDEAALGYNAYSLLKTGKDEYGIFLPFVLKSFGNYTPAVYSYLAIPSIALFGLSVFATRLPSAIMGILAVAGTFFLTKELLGLDGHNKRTTLVSLIAMFLLAISPWHIQFSRVAYEANIALTFCIYGLLFFLIGLRKSIWFVFSSISYGFAINTYHSPRLFVPLVLIGLFVIFKRILLQQTKYFILALIVGSIFLFPFVYYVAQGQSNQIFGRASETSIFTKSSNNMFGNVYHVFEGYVKHFSPQWIFISGDNDRHHAPSTGLLYIWEAPFFLIGLIQLIKKKGTLRKVFFLWFLLAPIPASLTTELPHAVRTLIFLPSFQIATAMGIETAAVWLHKRLVIKRILIGIPTISIMIFFILRYFNLYFYQMNHEFSQVWQFGYEHAVNYVEQHKSKYQQIVVSTQLEQPYIFYLFYTKYDPATYLAHGGTKQNGIETIDNIVFRPIYWNKENRDHTTLYMLSADEAYSNEVHLIRYFDSQPAMRFAE